MQLDTMKPKFSWLHSLTGADTKPMHDKVVFESKNFVVMPSLGSLVAGWLLVVPKRKIPNFSFINAEERCELDDILQDFKGRLELFGGAVHAFEHGGLFNSKISCGVDQAHLHLLPLSFNLVNASREADGVSWNAVSGLDHLSQVSDIDEYLFVMNSDGALLGEPNEPTSQWFRKVIASELGKSSEWNYREFPKLDVIDTTIAVLAS